MVPMMESSSTSDADVSDAEADDFLLGITRLGFLDGAIGLESFG
jgi:hypothetical protein